MFRSMFLVCGRRGGLFRSGFFIQEGDIFELGGGFCGGVGSGSRSSEFQTGGGMCYGADLAVFEWEEDFW